MSKLSPAQKPSSANLALIANYHPQRVIAWRQGKAISLQQFAGEVVQLAKRLEDCEKTTLNHPQPIINLCQSRYHFLLSFAAIIQQGYFNLLPASRSSAAISAVLDQHPNALCISDQPEPELSGHVTVLQLSELLLPTPAIDGASDRFNDNTGHSADHSAGDAASKDITAAHLSNPTAAIPPQQLAAIAYTSGSTGTPQPQPKTWGDLCCSNSLAVQRFFHASGNSAQGNAAASDTAVLANIVATVPPQHMYGLETSIMLALQGRCAVDDSQPLYPADIASAMSTLPAPRVLITTPFHLRACQRSTVPSIDKIISATAPLAADLAAEIEQNWATEVYEIYGCTEAGSLASRRPSKSLNWQLYDGMQLHKNQQAQTYLTGPQLPTAVPLADQLKILPNQQFELLGRNSDMLNIAGKRLSLGDLTQQILAVDGVEDAAVFTNPEQRHQRPRAIVVAPTLNRQQLVKVLAHKIDPVFIPRPLYFVDKLPRNAVGKLPQSELQLLFDTLKSQQKQAKPINKA